MKDAFHKALVTFKFFPKPIELIELIEGGNKEDQAVQACETLLNTIRSVGAYYSVIFEDSRIARTVEIMGGWEKVTSWTTDELKYRFKEFIQIYKSLPPSSKSQKVIGIIERENTVRGMLPTGSSDKFLCPTVVVKKNGIPILVDKDNRKPTSMSCLEAEVASLH